MTAYQLIQRKRDGDELPPGELTAFFRGYLEGRVTDYQMAAFLMVVFFRGLSTPELRALVEVMLRSGAVLDLSDLPGAKVDKHSTGGVGDKVSLVLGPLVASLGVRVPMMSGRGLGHTGGTLDKLESIPGFRTNLTLDEFRSQLERLGCALIGATAEIAPLDSRLYALRDVTATVESIPLIASSIMSKKLAEGIDALVLDVKHGSGAFLPDLDQALDLARTMIAIGSAYGRPVTALLTAMDRPCGISVGNALEAAEAIRALQGGGPADLRELTLALAVEMLQLAGAAESRQAAGTAAAAALADGRALECMRRVIEAQGGDPGVLDDPSLLPRAPLTRTLEAARDGYVAEVNARHIGEAAVSLGAGRARLEDTIDPAVGFDIPVKPGQAVSAGQPLGVVHARTERGAEIGLAALRSAIQLGEEMPAPPLPLITHRVTAGGVEAWPD
ncbi:MAG: thymidine phosphorylase [Gemmatimonadetes bacterium]|nr:thymidine phosphorylase [Gemmatimonadota bacterium]